jgi:CHAT domain-containing protein
MIKKSISFLLITISFLLFQEAISQNNKNKYSDQAENLFAQGEYSKVIPFANSNIDKLLNEQNIDSTEIAKLYLHLTASHYRLRENEKSIEISKKGLSFCLDTDDGNNTKAGILYWRSFPEFFLNKPYKSYESKKEVVEILKKNANPNLEFLTGAYAELSLDMAFMGYLDKASTYIDKALENNILKNETAKNNGTYNLDEDLELWLKFRIAQVNNKKIHLEFNNADQQKIIQVIQFYNAFKEQHPSNWNTKKRIMLGIIYSYYGNSFMTNSENFRNPDSALYYYKEASGQFKKSENKYQFNLLLYNISRAYKAKGDFNKALEIIDQLLIDDINANSSGYSTLKTELILNLNKFEDWKELVYETIVKIHDSTATLKQDFSNFVPSTSIVQIRDILSLAESIDDKYSDMPFLVETKKRLYDLSVKQFKASFRFSSFNARLKNYYKRVFKGKIEMIANNENIDSVAIRKLLNDTENIENRLAWKEFSKSRSVVNLPIIDSIEEVEYNLRKLLVDAKQNKAFREVDSIVDQLDQHNQRIEVDYPKYSEFSKEGFDIIKFQKKIAQHEVVLKYMYFNDKFVIFEITNNNIQLHVKPWGKEENKLLETHINEIKNSGFRSKFNQKLTNILLPSSISNYKKISVVADKPINQLPFETLIYKNKYLVESISISYSSHLRFIFFEENDNYVKNENPIVTIFAPNYPNEKIVSATRSGSYHLEGAQKEAKQLESLFPSQTFIGNTATKENFIKHKSEGKILHLAMHATIEEDNPDLSYFNFSNDEKLYLEELYALKIPADLAVLSACNTAVGKEDNSLNINSLHRAFNYAGTKATIASLWEVPDESTSQIMMSFYKHLKDGETKSTALQQAKLDYLNKTSISKFKHPYYWAGFVLYGEDKAITSKDASLVWYIVAFLMVFCSTILYKYHRNKAIKAA